ncbi:MAG: hypothetical protein DCC57_20495 [Chloroflexi bacterium]|nr:MAG: hypothetical protein DCC57_20495 [Chloroflexota bacterium]
MKIALIADIHGNSIALDAVLADAALYQPDLYCFLGDLVDGHDPSGVLERVTVLPQARFIAGNTEHYIITGEGPPGLRIDAIQERPDRLPVFQEATASWAWSKGWLCATGWFDWVKDLSIEEHISLPTGQTLLCVHSTPGYADGPGIGPHTDDAELADLVTGCGATFVCVGHTHVPFVRVISGIIVINPGAVSNPLAPDLRASYALLEVDSAGYNVNHRRVAYDHAAVITAVRRAQHPAAHFIIDHQLGNRTVEGMMAAAVSRRSMLVARPSSVG